MRLFGYRALWRDLSPLGADSTIRHVPGFVIVQLARFCISAGLEAKRKDAEAAVRIHVDDDGVCLRPMSPALGRRFNEWTFGTCVFGHGYVENCQACPTHYTP